MKRSMAIILVMVMAATMIFPGQALAAYDKELTSAINSAKSLFKISDAYDDFSYTISKQNDKTTFDLNWNDRKGKLGSMSVTIDTSGRVINYYAYKPFNYRDQKRLPAISNSEARIIADNFVQKVSPGIWKSLKLWPNNNVRSIADRNYEFRYIRIEHGIPFPENNVFVNVNGMTGEVESFRTNWYDDLVFPDPSGTISLENAQQQFKDKLGLKLLFQLSFSDRDRDPKPYLVYTNVYSNCFIDAKTGEVVRNDNSWGYFEDYRKTMRAKEEIGASPAAKALTPEELEAVQSAADIIDQNKAEEIARKTLNIDSSYKLNWVSLYTDWRNKDAYLWNMDFQREENAAGNIQYYGTGISMDAKEGSIISFYRSIPYDPDATVKYNESQAQQIAEDFIKSMQPEKFQEVELTAWAQPVIKPMENGDQPRQVNFTYTRLVNGAYFRDNGFNVTVDNVTGTVTNYNFSWYNKPLPATEKIITLDQAYKVMHESIGLQMQYVSKNPDDQGKYISPQGNIKPAIKLVYGVKPEKPLNIDAFTGILLDHNGKPFTTDSVTEYTDIKGSYAERQIKVLTEYGIALPGKQLNPKQSITQRDFLFLLHKTVNPYFEIKLSGEAEDDDALYNALIEAGILKDGERAPNSVITRQDAAKFLVRALNYDKVAAINKGIYKLPFTDASKIKPALAGYIAIAYGLNIIQGDQGKFNPNGSLTRADAFILLYNYLNV